MKIIKATIQEKQTYAETLYEGGTQKTLYPLYGWVVIDDQKCAVEFLNEADGPKYEVMIASGFHVVGEDLHSLLCISQEDLLYRCRGISLEKCGTRCD